MTENEKASTFIGWKPKTWCKKCEMIDANKHAELAAKFKVGHYVPAPDMTLPNNYMKALEAMDRWAASNTGRKRPTSSSWYVERDGIEIDRPTPVAALAALYDAEHPTESR